MSETTLKRIAPDANSFEANGFKYVIHPSLSVERYRQFERLQVIAGFGADYQTLYTSVAAAYDLINKMKVADCAVKLNGVLEGLRRPINSQPHPLLLLCTVFISREGEDITRWDEAEATEKIADWGAAGYDVADFFRLASHSSRLFLQNLGSDFQTSSTEAEGAR